MLLIEPYGGVAEPELKYIKISHPFLIERAVKFKQEPHKCAIHKVVTAPKDHHPFKVISIVKSMVLLHLQ